MSAKVTPMIQQYLEIKAQHQDAILFFRLGDFYEMFFEDAKIASKELEIVLTARDGREKIPMCGIPHHSATSYIAKLIDRGFKVAICEQVEDPKKAKGIVKREVIQVITPGTVLENSMLDEASNNYLMAIFDLDQVLGLAYLDVSTGDFWVTELTGESQLLSLESETQRLKPAECLIPVRSTFDLEWDTMVDTLKNTSITYIEEDNFNLDKANKVLLEHFDMVTLEAFGLQNYTAGICATATIINFLTKTQKISLKHIQGIRPYQTNNYLEMDYSTRKNLELTTALRDGKRDGSLLSILDYCATAMGKRTLKTWIEQPLRNVDDINIRLDAVEEIKNNLSLMDSLKNTLPSIYDLERLAGKIGSSLITPRDLLALKTSILSLKDIINLLTSCESQLLQSIAALDDLYDLYELINNTISDEPPLSIKEGYIFCDGYNHDIDELRNLSKQGSNWLVDFEASEKERLGIRNLKIGFNKVFGYYIELSNANKELAPPEYHRKQTLVNAERFICEELKNYEDRILGAREKLFNLEYEHYNQLKDKLIEYIPRIQNSAFQIAILDVVYSLAQVAYNNDYNRPNIDNSIKINIKNGRHPVVEQYLIDSRFVPNDVKIDGNNISFALITGPNMGGKSTYMRQIALLVLMAQMGSFIPAEYAAIGIADKIFTRVGASDDLAAGQSTFMLEMVEVANILNNATKKSLIILDEIGRGTSTYDGLSIAKAVSEYILSEINARTLFATHYHELTTLVEKHSSIINLSVSVKDTGDTVVFLKKVLPGKADKSYGVHVAKLAGLPAKVVNRANEILEELELEPNLIKPEPYIQPILFDEKPDFIKQLNELVLDDITPFQALSYLHKWKEEIT
ncbi:MAG TPA: DNA mismatch repair protein MutS [Syntrophomonadaceae bacterium]|nr:DNA mismatch repair protein MutS [Syntrophomonadaceae bacterium]